MTWVLPSLPPETHVRYVPAANLLSSYELNFQGDGYFVADENTACFKRSVPRQTEIFAIDLGYSRQTYTGVAPGVFSRRGRPVYCELYVARHSVNRELA